MLRSLPSAFLAVAICSISVAARPLDKVAKDALTVGIGTDNPPFGYNETADRKGLEYDLVAALAEGMGVHFRVVKLGSQREGEEKLLADRVDIVIGSVKSTEDLRDRFLTTVPYFRTGLGIMVLKSNQSVYTLSDLNGRPVAATPESNADKLIENFIPKAKLELVRTTTDGLTLLGTGEVDAFVNDRSTLQAESARNPAMRILDVSLTADNYVILVNKKSGTLLDALNSELNRMRTPPSPDSQCPLALLCAKYKLGFTVTAANRPGSAGVAVAPVSPRATATRDAPQDVESRLEAVERQLKEVQANLAQINAELRASGR
ncbi:MAG TPA: transporter substrate-binding domain-containing protein [Fibrobacteria bacterium]|nr:transporter substrate-binding domain-containing protein [Fibrobacteria bacterium]